MHRSSKIRRSIVSVAASLALAMGTCPSALGSSKSSALGQVGTSVTYQGQLKNNGVAVNSPADVQLSMQDAAIGGAQVGDRHQDRRRRLAGVVQHHVRLRREPVHRGRSPLAPDQVRNPSNVGGFHC